MGKPESSSFPIRAAGLLAGAASASVSGIHVAYTSGHAFTLHATEMPMNAQDQAFIDSRIDSKTAELKGDVRVNTEAMKALKDRLDDFSSRMSSVPTDIAAMKATILTLPDKDWVGTKFRNYLAVAGVGVTLANAVISWGPKLFGH